MSIRDLRVARGLSWPASLASQASALLGVRGAGKSNLARVVAEECYRSEIPFVVFDPIGMWHGIRAGRDGRPKGGLPIAIFGGEHGDLPLERSSGVKVADLVLERRLSCVLDLSHPDFSETDKRRFLTEFGDRLFRRKQRKSGWLLLILEEADDYAPQQPRGPQAECLAVFQRILKRGRFKGLGALMVTQRGASFNKDLLYMIGTLVAFRTTGPRDREAIEGWLKYQAQSIDVAESLPGLADGEAWVWSPEFLKELRRIKFRQMETFDTGSTPEHGAASGPPATLVDIDLPALSKELQEAVERAKANDPDELKRKVTELQAALRKAEQAKPAPVVPAPKRVEVPAIKPADIQRLERAAEKIAKAAADAEAEFGGVGAIGRAIRDAIYSTKLREGVAAAAAPPMPQAGPRAARGVAPGAGRVSPAPGVRSGNGHDRLPRAQQGILDAIGWLQGVGVERPDKAQVALFADLSPVAGHTVSSFGALRTAGLIDYPSPGFVVLTEAGASMARTESVPQTAEEMQRQVLAKLPRAQRGILEVLIGSYPSAMQKADVATGAGLSVEAGHTVSSFGRLRTLGLIDYPRPGDVVARPVLFLGAGR